MNDESSAAHDGRIVVRVEEDLLDLIPGFLENRSEDIRAMREALERADYVLIRRRAHDMKGAGGGYGFDGVSRIGAGMEQAALNRDAAGVARGLDELADYLARVVVQPAPPET
jgi:HPt (histidine-containing phosphotransfer) domain-containing protein